MRKVLIGALAALVLLGTACGGDDDDKKDDATESVDSDDGGGDEEATDDGGDGAANEFCGVIQEFRTFAEATPPPIAPLDATKLDDIIDRAKATAPEELGDLDSYFDATLTYYTSEEGGGLEGDAGAEYEAKGETINEYVIANCGFDGNPTGDGGDDDAADDGGSASGSLEGVWGSIVEEVYPCCDDVSGNTWETGNAITVDVAEGTDDGALDVCTALSERLAQETFDGEATLTVQAFDGSTALATNTVSSGDAGECVAA